MVGRTFERVRMLNISEAAVLSRCMFENSWCILMPAAAKDSRAPET